MITKDCDNCTGCGACYTICPTKAITFKMHKGFEYPEINLDLCIKCNKCKRVCPALNVSENAKNPIIKIGNTLNENIRKNSSSGGIFYELALYMLNELNGIVYGAAYSSDFSVKHIRVSDAESLTSLCTSKYVQSSIGNCISEAISDLKNGKKVLFSGTPCQTEAVKRVCPDKLKNNLYLCSVACHGVASPVLWKNYCKALEYRYEGKITKVNMRDKRKGWHRFSIAVGFENGKEYSNIHDIDPYFRLFLSGCYLRPSCYSCKAKGLLSNTDFLIADAWGYESHTTHLTDDKGKSIICLMTDKASDLIKKSKVAVEDYSQEIIIKTHHSIFESAHMVSDNLPELRDMPGDEAYEFFKKNGKMKFGSKAIFYIKLLLGKIGIMSLVRKVRR